MRYFLTIILFFKMSLSLSQFSEDRSNRRIELIKNMGADTIIYYQTHQYGQVVFEKNSSCFLMNPEFILWKLKGKTYYQKFVDCYENDFISFKILYSKPVLNDTSKVFDFLCTRLKDIRYDEILPPVIKWSLENEGAYKEVRTSHPLVFKISFYFKDDSFSKEFTNTAFRDSIAGVRNLNRSYNQKTTIKLLKDKIEKEIMDLENEQLFKF